MSTTLSSCPAAAQLCVYPPSQQGSGSFDGGRITEIKPIGFSGEGSTPSRIGPLFYWAWAVAEGPSTISLHPHKGFEIVSYVLKGEIGHLDTGGHEGRIRAGGVQLMQTGSGISHEERTFDGRTEFLQVWFEPNLSEAVTRPPEYCEYADNELPVSESSGVRVKSIIGSPSPIRLVADARMEHWTLAANAAMNCGVIQGRKLAILAVAGCFCIKNDTETRPVRERDFAVLSGCASNLALVAGETGAEAITIDVPTEVPYRLLKK